MKWECRQTKQITLRKVPLGGIKNSMEPNTLPHRNIPPSIESVLASINSCRLNKTGPHKRVAFVSGNFNIIHPGHLRLLEFAASCSDILVVGVTPDSAKGVLFPQKDRFASVQMLSAVDFPVALPASTQDFLTLLRPEIVVKGKEHENQFNPETAIVKSYGGKVIFGSGETKLSSLELLNAEFNEPSRYQLQRPVEFLDRHKVDYAKTISTISKMQDLKVLVIGDLIIDEYITCDALGMSQEDTTLVVSPVLTKKFVGGAGIVASHAAGLGADVRFLSVVGDDENAHYASEKLRQYGVKAELFRDESRPTTLKQRFRTQDKTLLRVSHLRQHSISEDISTQIMSKVRNEIHDADLVLFSCFNYGCLPTKLVDQIYNETHKAKVLCMADSQSSSQVGNISRFQNMNLITPTEREARLAMGDFESGLVTLAESLRQKAKAENVFITLGSEGILIHAADPELSYITDSVRPLNTSPKDPSGAGDSLFVSSSMALAAGADIWTSVYIGLIAAGLQVGRVGNIPLSHRDLIEELRQ